METITQSPLYYISELWNMKPGSSSITREITSSNSQVPDPFGETGYNASKTPTVLLRYSSFSDSLASSTTNRSAPQASGTLLKCPLLPTTLSTLQTSLYQILSQNTCHVARGWGTKHPLQWGSESGIRNSISPQACPPGLSGLLRGSWALSGAQYAFLSVTVKPHVLESEEMRHI